MEKYVVILSGAAADEKYARRFRDESLRLFDVLVTHYGYRSDHITLLAGHGDPTESKISGPCRQETITASLDNLKTVVQPGDQILFFLIGHGTSNEGGAKFNIVGPDMTGKAFSQMLNAFSDQDIIVVNTTSASHPFCTELSAPGRVIISATRSYAEKYDTVFAGFFTEALENHNADRDKNTRVSMWEAFQYTKQTVEKWYTEQNRLPSEHSALDDNGDALLNTHPDPLENDGRLAQIAYLDVFTKDASVVAVKGSVSPAVHELIQKLHQLERSVFLLRNRKRELPSEDYKQLMETLLINLAKTNRDLKILRSMPQER
jgi:hypothetical protein